MNLGAMWQAFGGLFGIRTEEQPAYDVIVRDGRYEIRSYHRCLIARTYVGGNLDQAQNEAFRILAGYIFGGNVSRQALAMTAPVVQERAAPGEKLPMTAPVLQEAADDALSMAFVMPSAYTLETLPKPLNDRIRFEEVPPRTVAAVRFSGSWRADRIEAQVDELRHWLDRQGAYRSVSPVRFAAYDPPWTIPGLRRNEVHLDVAAEDVSLRGGVGGQGLCPAGAL